MLRILYFSEGKIPLCLCVFVAIMNFAEGKIY